MRDRVRESLAELGRTLEDLKAPIAPALAAGADHAEVETFLGSLGLAVSADVVDWFAWHNGVRPDAPIGAAQIVGRWDLLSLDGAKWWTRVMRESVADAGPGTEGLWAPGWVPLAVSDGDLVVIDLDSPEPHTILFRQRESAAEDICLGLAALAGLWIDALVRGDAEWLP